jgi:pimeloyl-ACP methyl ester carboxylesterase
MLETWQHDCIHTNGINLHYVTQGEGPLIVFLHGFPDFWYSWRHQIPEFAKDYKVVAPDLRGYNDSDKPASKEAYTMPEFIADIKGLIEGLGYQQCILVGHDWGGIIAWNFAYAHPEMLSQLVILNAPHVAKFAEGLMLPQQLLRSWYIFFFQVPFLPEMLLQFDDFKAIETAFAALKNNPNIFTEADLNFYKDAFAKRGALTAAINYYRNFFQPELLSRKWSILEIPTLMIWGEQDKALGKELSYGTEQYVKDFRIRYIPESSHWVQQQYPDLVNQHIREFLGNYL